MFLNFKSKFILIAFVTYFSFRGFAFASDAVTFTGQINADHINVRVDATVGATPICILSKYALVEVVGQAYDWYKIRLPKDAPAYIKKNLVECINADPVSNPGRCLGAKVIKERINVRLSPSESSWIIGKIDKQAVVNILSSQGDWYKITPVFESFGWVHTKFVDKDFSATLKKVKPPVILKETHAADQLVIEGKVSPYGIVLWRRATHKLITSQNKIYLLAGNRKSLDSLNYKAVKVTGKIIGPVNSQYPIVGVDIIEVLN